ncbi:spinster family MFS transporter [Caulobacter soli]|uniref:spinster family MFS transporter n=1 Tax=Caulobacter soli TaxID=2708539 RepID=UPI0013EE1FDA|nr:MFS transporter [Caulobacter soli]
MSSAVRSAPGAGGEGSRRRYWALLVMTLVYGMNIADRFVLSTLIEPIKHDFHLSDSAVGFLTGVALALFYTAAGLPLGALADRVNRRNMIIWALALWSAFTALCGLAQTFWHLLLARIGVGIGEAGGTPPSHSILADYFRPSERIVAMSIYALGIALGSAIGGIGGGMLAERFGWRQSLIIFACASAPVLLLLMTVREPKRGAADSGVGAEEPAAGLRASMAFIRGQRSLLHVLAGATIATFSGMGLVWWTPAFLGRSHGLTVGEAGAAVGLMSGVGGALALIVSTLITLRLARLPAKWQCHFLAWVTLLITIPGVAAHAVADKSAALILLWLFVPFTNVYVGPTLALLQNLVRANMRGVTVAALLFTANIANLAIAPQLIGLASDLLAAHLADPAQSLRIALAFSALTGLWAAVHFWAAIRTLPSDLRRAGAA